ncbi:MAG: TonB family protein [Bdellovibrionales bacterium]|nr:TonB family protein [Bdellovibrionales bacterium]
MKNNMIPLMSMFFSAIFIFSSGAGASGFQMTMSRTPADIQSSPAPITEGETPFTLPAHNKDDIRRAIDNQVSQLLTCYEALLEQKPKKEGKIVMSWAIDKKGEVNSPKVVTSNIKSKTLEKCALNAVKSWSFPEGVALEDTEIYITYPFDFKLSQND